MAGMKKRRVARMVFVPDDEPTDYIRIIKRQQVAKMFGVSAVRIDQLASMGVLRKVKLPGISRAMGFVEAEVRELLLRRQAK